MTTEKAPQKGVLKVRATIIRDGTLGISLALGSRLVGEWTDSRAKMLAVSDDHKIKVLGADGEMLYLFSAPGKTLSAELVSETEVAISFEL